MTPYDRAACFETAFANFVPFGAGFIRAKDSKTDEERLFATWSGGQNYRNKSEMYGCLDGGTRILTADLRWVAQRDLRVGDELMGVSEVSTAADRRKLQLSKVLAVGPVQLPSVRVRFDDGTTVVCSCNHKWLTSFPAESRWLDAAKLRLGDRVRRIVTPWADPDPLVAGWMGGIIDGEAHLSVDSGLVFRISQNPGAVLSRICSTLDTWQIPYRLYEKKGHRCKDVCLPSTVATLRLMGLAPTERFARKWIGRDLPISTGKWATVVGLEAIGVADLFGMTTSTHTFVAEGLATHNSYPAGYLERVFAMFPDARRVLHLFSGSLTAEQVENWQYDLILADPPYGRVDAHRYWYESMYALPGKCAMCGASPDRHVPRYQKRTHLGALVAPPGPTRIGITLYPHELQLDGYVRFKPLNKAKVVSECHKVLRPGGWLCWMDTVWPMYSKRMWVLRGTITFLRSTNHRVRVVFLFERR